MTASPESLQQRYEAIERVYSERQWDSVNRLSEELLLELPDDDNNPLRQRLQLLLGHTYLYGYQDTAKATGFYTRVRAVTSEAVLRDIADQGLEQCASQTPEPTPEPAPEPAPEPTPPSDSTPPIAEAPATAGGQAFPFNATPVAAEGGAPGARPAMPWMTQVDEPPVAATVESAVETAAEPTPELEPQPQLEPVTPPELVVEVVDEPELIDVAQADPARAEELEVAISAEITPEPVGGLSPEEIADLSKGLLRVVIR